MPGGRGARSAAFLPKQGMARLLKITLAVAFLALTACLVVFKAPYPAEEAHGLHLAVARKRPIARGQTHDYSLNLLQGQFARVEVCQRDIDLHLSLTRPDGSRLPDMNGSEWGTEALSVIASLAGTYHIGVSAEKDDSATGSYVITVTEIRPATQDDQKGEQAQRVFAQGLNQVFVGTAQSMDQAIRSFDDASRLWQAAGDGRREAQALGRLGFACQRQGQYERAVDSFQRAVAIWQQLRDDYGLAETWPQLANASGHFGVSAKTPRDWNWFGFGGNLGIAAAKRTR